MRANEGNERRLPTSRYVLNRISRRGRGGGETQLGSSGNTECIKVRRLEGYLLSI